MFFDRNEIHIQALVVFSEENVAFFNPHLRKTYYKKYRLNIFPKQYFPKIKNDGFAFQKLRTNQILDTHISKNNIFKDDSMIFLYCLSHFGNS